MLVTLLAMATPAGAEARLVAPVLHGRPDQGGEGRADNQREDGGEEGKAFGFHGIPGCSAPGQAAVTPQSRSGKDRAAPTQNLWRAERLIVMTSDDDRIRTRDAAVRRARGAVVGV